MRYQKMMKIGLFGLMIASLFFLTGCFGFFTDWFAPLPEPEEIFVAPFDPEAIMVDPVTGAEFVSNQVIVEFKDDVARATIEAVIAGLDCIIVGEITVFNHTRFQLKIPDGAVPIDLVAQFKESPYVKWAGVNHIAHIETPAGNTSAFKPNDPYFQQQWALHKIDAPKAWGAIKEKGHPNVTIAILDTGVNYNYEDLSDNLRMPRGFNWDLVDIDRSPMDESEIRHGTGMAGVAVARMNDKGVVGVAPGATFLPVRVLGHGKGPDFAAAAGIAKAYIFGNARIFNMSFGTLAEMETLNWVVSIMLFITDDVLFIASAGNRNEQDLTSPPGDHEGIMAVAATDRNDRRWGGSNFHRGVDIAAPGHRVYITTGGHPFPPIHKYYWQASGTSIAAATVSGVAALIWSLDYRTDGDFDLTGRQVWDIIEASADSIDCPYYLNEKLGAGRVNAFGALREAERKLGIDPVVTFPDPHLEAAVRETLGIEPGVNIYRSDVERLTGLSAGGRDISDLTGLEYAVNLEFLDLCDNRIIDITPLAGLTRLSWLCLGFYPHGGNKIIDITSIAGLINLNTLYLDYNQITDIGPLVANEGLSAGDTIFLRGNPLSERSLEVYIPELRARGVLISLERGVAPSFAPKVHGRHGRP